MSSSPKFTIIDLAFELDAAHLAAIARRAAARGQRQDRRDAEFRRLRADRTRQAAEGERTVIAARLAAVSSIISALPAGGAARTRAADSLAADIGALRDTAAAGSGLSACLREAERLRDRALDLSARAHGSAHQSMTRLAVLTALRERLAEPGHDGAKLDPAGYARCADLLGQLETATREDGVRFEALRGTAEHAVAGYVERGTAAAGAAQAARNEAADLLAALSSGILSAAADARALHDDELAQMLDDALAGATDALADAQADPNAASDALARARGLAAVLPDVEARLDDLAAAYERRAAFAATLKDVLADQGMSFLGTSETRDRFILQFERPGGALYTAAVDDGEDNELMLSYAIDGEADVPVLPEPGQAVCDQTEAFLDAIHAELAQDGYHAGELLWEGKPTGPRSPRAHRSRADQPRERRIRETP